MRYISFSIIFIHSEIIFGQLRFFESVIDIIECLAESLFLLRFASSSATLTVSIPIGSVSRTFPFRQFRYYQFPVNVLIINLFINFPRRNRAFVEHLIDMGYPFQFRNFAHGRWRLFDIGAVGANARGFLFFCSRLYFI